MLRAEKLLGPVYRELLCHVHVLAATVIALARIALRVLVGQHRALAVEDRLRHEVLRAIISGVVSWQAGLVYEHLGDLGIHVRDVLREVVGA